MRFLTEGGRKKREGKGRREKQDPAPNSIEGERSQFGLAAEGRLRQLVSPEAAVASRLPLIPGFMEKGVPATETDQNIFHRAGRWV